MADNFQLKAIITAVDRLLGENILSCDTEKSIRERFSVYQVAGQRAGNDDDFGEATTTALRARTHRKYGLPSPPSCVRSCCVMVIRREN